MAKKKKQKISGKEKFLNPKFIGFLLLFIFLGIGFVYSRMRRVEVQYQVNSIIKKIENENQKNKALKAKKADLMSVKNLKKIARKYNLKEPNQKQIIVIPQ